MAGFDTLTGNPNYFLQHPFTYDDDDIDYVTVAISGGYSIDIPCFKKIGLGPGTQVPITRDRFGRWYPSLGLVGGASGTLPASVCIVAGKIINGDREKLADTLASFIPGKSLNFTVAAGGCISETQSGDIKAMEIGFSTPQISLSTNWADEIEAVIKKYLIWW